MICVNCKLREVWIKKRSLCKQCYKDWWRLKGREERDRKLSHRVANLEKQIEQLKQVGLKEGE